ncbi:unnamed protein product [Nezara viridula]|uniref:Uncharacterized protein n=1 Tax=Nezara viridula TaxID=85310 RepID=A0A9P0MVX1_NEZVI|nr:unnamed protein product [Nezara viridula]
MKGGAVAGSAAVVEAGCSAAAAVSSRYPDRTQIWTAPGPEDATHERKYDGVKAATSSTAILSPRPQLRGNYVDKIKNCRQLKLTGAVPFLALRKVTLATMEEWDVIAVVRGHCLREPRQGWHANRYGVTLLTEVGDKVFSLRRRPLFQIAS